MHAIGRLGTDWLRAILQVHAHTVIMANWQGECIPLRMYQSRLYESLPESLPKEAKSSIILRHVSSSVVSLKYSLPRVFEHISVSP
jgi:hypothetical protein